MKIKVLLGLIVFLLLFTANCFESRDFGLIGRWKFVLIFDKEQKELDLPKRKTIYLSFRKDGKVYHMSRKYGRWTAKYTGKIKIVGEDKDIMKRFIYHGFFKDPNNCDGELKHMYYDIVIGTWKATRERD